MSVYVDNYCAAYRGMKMSHLAADSLDELHEMAERLGLRREWFQDKNLPHYDVCKSKRALAIKLGAKEVSSRKIVEVARGCKMALKVESAILRSPLAQQHRRKLAEILSKRDNEDAMWALNWALSLLGVIEDREKELIRLYERRGSPTIVPKGSPE